MSDMSDRQTNFVIKGKPVGKGRPRWSGTHMYSPTSTRLYEAEVARVCRAAMGRAKPRTEPVGVVIRVFKKVPSHVNKRTKEMMLEGKLFPTARPDLDNVVKSVLDGCNGIAYEDDAQVVHICAEAWYAEEPCVEVMIWQAK